ncbi:MAG: SRPBCC family protein, partial [Gammaproteobacteria bacterium]|nr:SRPBCC family protein [Gammaproteobacteria bacterium]
MQPDDIRTAYDPANVVRSITIEIDAPAAIVWEVLTDLPDYNHWNPMCVRAESTLQLGAPIRMKLVNYANPGTLIPVVEYVCAVEPQRLL